jgi:hypothetical protein
MFSGGVFGIAHLSEDAVAAFADGALSPSARSRATRHCAECAECAEAVQVQRDAADMLRSAAQPSVPSGLLDRLSGVPMSAPLPPPSGGLPMSMGSDGQPVLVSYRTNPPWKHPTQHSLPNSLPNSAASQAGHAAGTVRRPMRRVVLPLGVAASVAAVIAAGAFAGQTQRGNGPVTGGSANLSGVVSGTTDGASRKPQLLGTVIQSVPAAASTPSAAPSTTAASPGSAGGVASVQPARLVPAEIQASH